MRLAVRGGGAGWSAVNLEELTDGRFERQQRLPGLDEAWPQRLAHARVQVVGAGPVAAPALLQLARSGVGLLYVDDGADVDPWDLGAWLYPPERLGRSRALVALEALAAASPTVEARPFASDTSASALLICSQSEGQAQQLAARALAEGLPHVIARGDGENGEVIVIPPGAPCYACFSRPGAGVLPRGGTATALGSLAALELLLLLAGLTPDRGRGRRILLSQGRPRVEATVRRVGCACAQG